MDIARSLNIDPEAYNTGVELNEHGPEVSGLVLGLMDRNMNESIKLQRQIDEDYRRRIQELEEELRRTQDELAAVRYNITSLLYPTIEGDYWNA